MLGEAENIFDPDHPNQVVLRYTGKLTATDVEMRYFDISRPAEAIEQGQELTMDVPLEVVIDDPGFVYVKWTSPVGQRFAQIARVSHNTARYLAKDGEPDVPDAWGV